MRSRLSGPETGSAYWRPWNRKDTDHGADFARECKMGLVSYTITHHTRQSAIGLPFISRKNLMTEKSMAVTEYTMSEIVASIYDRKSREPV